MIDPLGFHHDVVAVYRQVFKQFDIDPAQSICWHFGFRSNDENHLLHLTESLRLEWLACVESHVENPGEEIVRMSPPILVVSIDGAYTCEEIELYYTRLAELAVENGLQYLGLGVEEPFNPYAGNGWMPLETAIWQFRVLDLKEGQYVPFVFAIEPANATARDALLTDLQNSDLGLTELVVQESSSLVLVHISGRNDDDLLRAKYIQLERLAKSYDSLLIGVDYYKRKPTDAKK